MPAGGLPLPGFVEPEPEPLPVAGPEPLPVMARGLAPSEERPARPPLDSELEPDLSLPAIIAPLVFGVVEPFN
ncbi:hypothetical protein GCM10009777_10620 [Microbacterium pumilum]|uniref:Uncharacterized protein n=1 Tax=Microbacterium pumilum TaxID=344165 RepID=A0ABP5DH84_9MICO